MHRLVPRLRCLALVCATSLTAEPSFAQSSGAPVLVKPAAETLFEEGRALMQQQRYSEACAKFEASQGMDAGIGTLLHLADCYEKMGRTASAWATFKEAASMSRLRAQEERERIANTRAAALESKLSRLTIRVPEAHRIEGLEISLEGNRIPRASWETAIPVDPGPLTVQASAPGREAWTSRVEVAAGAQDNAVEVPLLEISQKATTPAAASESVAASASVAADTDHPGQGQRTAAWILGGVGVVGLGVGAVLGLQAKHKNDDSKDYCPNDPNLCTPHGVNLRDSAKKDAMGSTIAFSAGGALVVTGLILLLTAPSSSPSKTEARVANPSKLQIGLNLGPRLNTVQIGSAF